jgi:hypothetical protein
MNINELGIIITALKSEKKEYGYNENGYYYINTDVIPYFEKWLNTNKENQLFIHNCRFTQETINGICYALYKSKVINIESEIIEKLRNVLKRYVASEITGRHFSFTTPYLFDNRF